MIKYRIPYYDNKNNGWRIELSNLSYSGDIINLNTTQGNGCTIKYTGTDDPTETVIYSTASFTILKHNLALVDVKEFKDAGDKDWSVDVYKNNSLFWTGYLVPDGIQEYYQALPYDIELTATDGLKLLQGTRYLTNNWELPVGVSNRSFISHIRDILFMNSQLGKPLPIRWVGYLKNYYASAIQGDAFTDMTYSPAGEGYTDYNGNPYSSYFILTNYLLALNSRIYQCGGKWRIERIPDVSTGTYQWTEINTVYDPVLVPTLTTGIETRLQNIGTDFLVDNGAYTLNLPGLKKVTATYAENKSENSLPNGTFDSGVLSPLLWYPTTTDVILQQVDSINARAGSSLDVLFPSGSMSGPGTQDIALRTDVGGFENKLPIDTQTMYKRMSIGFTLMPQNGFPFDPTTGLIQWDLSPFKFRIECTSVGSTQRVYTLNENGFWIKRPTGSSWEIYALNHFVSGSVITTGGSFQGNPIIGDNMVFQFNTNPEVTVPVTQATSNDKVAYLTYAGQYIVDNSAGVITSFNVTPAGVGQYVLNLIGPYTSGAPTSLWKLTVNLSNTNRDGSITLLPEASKIGDVLQVNFDKFQGIKLPDFTDDPTYQYSQLNWFFYVNRGQRYTLDDVYIQLDDNSEVYDYEYPDNKFTGTEDYTLRISSSTNGFYTTNVMSSYDKSFIQSKYIDSTSYVGTLTDLFARTVVKMRSKSLEMFEGKLLGDNFEFGTIFTIPGFEGKKMLPLSASYNTENCEIDITCVEINVGDDSFVRSFYGSNDKPLSNEIIN